MHTSIFQMGVAAMIDEHKKTKKGYLRFEKDQYGKVRMQHCLIWERNYGAIPAGMQVHHKDFDKTNNAIENLELLTPLEHKRIHEGCRFVNGQWEKPCAGCGEYKPCTQEYWYFSRGWMNGKLCKPCYSNKVSIERFARIKRGWKPKHRKDTK